MDCVDAARLLGHGSGGFVFYVESGGQGRAIKIRKKARDDQTSHVLTTSIVKEGMLLKSLDHKNILKFISEVSGPLPDQLLQLIPDPNEKVQIEKCIRYTNPHTPTGLICAHGETHWTAYPGVDVGRGIPWGYIIWCDEPYAPFS